MLSRRSVTPKAPQGTVTLFVSTLDIASGPSRYVLMGSDHSDHYNLALRRTAILY